MSVTFVILVTIVTAIITLLSTLFGVRVGQVRERKLYSQHQQEHELKLQLEQHDANETRKENTRQLQSEKFVLYTEVLRLGRMAIGTVTFGEGASLSAMLSMRNKDATDKGKGPLPWQLELLRRVEAAEQEIQGVQHRIDFVASPEVSNLFEALHQALIHCWFTLYADIEMREPTLNMEEGGSRLLARWKTMQHRIHKECQGQHVESLFLNLRNQIRSEFGLATIHTQPLASHEDLDFRFADLREANLPRAKLEKANFFGADFYRAVLVDANLSEADLSEANLSETDLSGANLIEADLRDANLSRANLSNTDLSGANLSGANLRGTKLNMANLDKANLSGADLQGALGLSLAQIEPARPDEATILPSALTLPEETK